jgi:hypothetical protein
LLLFYPFLSCHNGRVPVTPTWILPPFASLAALTSPILYPLFPISILACSSLNLEPSFFYFQALFCLLLYLTPCVTSKYQEALSKFITSTSEIPFISKLLTVLLWYPLCTETASSQVTSC